MFKSEAARPFRWDIEKRNQLGSLASITEFELKEWVAEELIGTYGGWMAFLEKDAPYDWLLDEISKTAARILAQSADADLYFVGRSAEGLFDFLSCIFAGKSKCERLHLLPLSIGTSRRFAAMVRDVSARHNLKRHLTRFSLDPGQIVGRDRPMSLVDLVGKGATFGSLVTFLNRWCVDEAVEWKQLRPKLRLIGLTERTKTSPKTWRWHQHADWVSQLPKHAIKNVSVPVPLFHYLGASQSKSTASFHPGRWTDDEVARPRHDRPTRMAVRLALALYDAGRSEEHRHLLARRLGQESAVRFRWYRRLVREVVAP